MKQKLKFKSDSGLTFVELMLAAGILAVSMAMLFGSLISVGTMNEIAESRTRAEADLITIMEEVEVVSRLPVENLIEYQAPELYGVGTLETITVECVTDAGDRIALPAEVSNLPEGGFPNPARIECTISWYCKQRPMSVKASTWIHR